MSNPLHFSLEFGKADPDARPKEGVPLRILLMMDLGAGTRSQSEPLQSRAIRQVDIDSFEDLMERESPGLEIGGGALELRELDDFHPDQIFAVLPELQKLRDLRRRLKVPSMFEAAAAEVQAMLHPGEASAEAAPSAPESDGDTLARLLGKTTEDTAHVPPTATGGFLTNLLRDAVAAHVVAATDPRAEHYIAALDAALAAQMRAVLRDPGFLALERAWRGLDFLVSNVETDETASLHLWNVTKDELVAALDGEADLQDTLLYRRLVVEREDAPFTLIVTDMAFGADPQELRLLGDLGVIAAGTGALVFAGATPKALGVESWEALAQAPGSLETPANAWTALRQSAVAERVAAFAPGFLLRTPYGKRLDPIDAFAFEELEDPAAERGALPWGAPALLATVLLAQSFARDGWALRLNTNLEFGDLPVVAYEADGVPHMLPCAETLLPDRAAEAILAQGIVPLVANRSRNVVRLPYFQTIAGSAAKLGPFET